MKDKKDKSMKTSTVVALVVGAAAVTGIAVWGFSAKAAAPKRPKLPRAPKSNASGGGSSADQEPETTNKLPQQPSSGAQVDGGRVRHPVVPDPREASWSELEDTVALLSPNAQWRFAVPEERAGVFPEGEVITLRMDSAEGMVAAQTTATSVGFNLISRVGPSISFNRESGILQIYAGGYVGRLEIDAGGLSLSAWVLSENARMTLGADQRSRHLIDQRVDGVWQAHAFIVDEDGTSTAHEFGEFLSPDAAYRWADAWLDEQLEAA